MCRRAGEEPVAYLHPLLQPALTSMLGVLLFQEQVLLIARDVAGFTPGQGELLRRALGAKQAGAEVERLRGAFLSGANGRRVRLAGLTVVHQSPPTARGTHFVTLVDEKGLVIYNGREYAFAAQNYGDWYNIQSVLDSLNDILADAGRMERFLSLYTGDQTAAVVFAPEGPFLAVARTLHLPLEQDRHAPMQRGVAFENRVMDDIKKQQERDAHLQRASLLHVLVPRFLGRNGRGK